MTLPTLRTNRLTLRIPEPGDAKTIERLLRDPDIADGVLNIPYPIALSTVKAWISDAQDRAEAGAGYSFGLIDSANGDYLGTVSLKLAMRHYRGEIGYWIGKDYWGKGYMTEAVASVIRFGFESLELNRLYADCFPTNVGSEKVMQKCGMKYEGRHRQAVFHEVSGEYRDLLMYSILREEFANPSAT